MEWDLLLGAEGWGAVMSGAQIVMITLTLPSTPTLTAQLMCRIKMAIKVRIP